MSIPKKFAVSLVALLLVVGGIEVYLMNHKSDREIKIAFAGLWKSIHPGLQHTLVGDLTLSNQFEALVGFGMFQVICSFPAWDSAFSA